VPGITSVSFSTLPPLAGAGAGFGGLTVEGLVPPRDRNASVVFVTPGYFETLHTPIVAGRNLLDTDTATSRAVVVVNEAFQRRFAAGVSVLNRRIMADDLSMTIVGIARDVVPKTLRDQTEPLIFVPLVQSARTSIFSPILTLAVRTTGARAPEAIADVRRAIWSVEPSAVIADVITLDDRVAESLRTERQSAAIFSGLAAIALLIAAFGVYGVATYAVVQRTRELGIRAALGADQRDLMRVIGRHAIVPVLGGIGLGIVVAIGATRMLASLLYGVTALDAGSFLAAAGVLTIAAMVATIAPTCRLLRLDPLKALRTE
jgi:putative ABC transport system permease protein